MSWARTTVAIGLPMLLLCQSASADCLAEFRSYIVGKHYKFAVRSVSVEVPEVVKPVLPVAKYVVDQGRNHLSVYDHGYVALVRDDDFFASTDHGQTWTFQRKTNYWNLLSEFDRQSEQLALQFVEARCDSVLLDGRNVRRLEAIRTIDGSPSATFDRTYYVDPSDAFVVRWTERQSGEAGSSFWDIRYYREPDFIFPKPSG